ncbi:MAG: hypothetical protein KJ760_19120, partial [Proteobacteria bacterium]|nr:hypothetical protein [Pseudomonadota bacterium]
FTGTLNFLLTASDNKNVDCVSLAHFELDPRLYLTQATTGGNTIAVSDVSLVNVDNMICVYDSITGDTVQTVKVMAKSGSVLTVSPALASYSVGAGAGIWQIDSQDCAIPYQLSLNVSGFDEGLYVFTSMPKDIAGNVNYPKWTGDDCSLELDIEHVEEITIAGVNDAADSSLYADIAYITDTSAPRTTADDLIVTGTFTSDDYVYADSVTVNIWYIKQIECGDTWGSAVWDSVDNDNDGQFGEDRTVNGIDEDCCDHDTTHDDGEDSVNSRDNWFLAGQATVTDDVAGDGLLNYTYNWNISALHGVYKFKAEANLNDTVYASTEETSSVWCDGYTRSYIIAIDHECPIFTDQDGDGDAFTGRTADEILNAEQDTYTVQVDPKDSGAFCNYSLDTRSDSGVDRVCFSYNEGSGWVSIDGTDNDSDGSLTEDPVDGVNNDTDYIGQDNEVIRDMDGDGCFDLGSDIVLYDGGDGDTDTLDGYIMTPQIDEDDIDCDLSGPPWTANLDVTELTPSNMLAVTLRAEATDVNDSYEKAGTTCDTTMIIYVDNIAPEARLLSADSTTVSPQDIITENIVPVIEWSDEGILLVAEVDFNPVDAGSWSADDVNATDADGNPYDVANISFWAWEKHPISGNYIGAEFPIGTGDSVDNDTDGVPNAYTVRWQGNADTFAPGTYDVYAKATDVNGNNETDTSEMVTVIIHDLSGPEITLGGVGLPVSHGLCDYDF